MNHDEVRRCQLKQLEALKFIDKVCSENGLTYFVHTGTLLGAVRHHGYIPWDMDTDILMPREDSEKLAEIVKEMDVRNYYISHSQDKWADRLVMRNVKAYGSAAASEEDQYVHIDIYSYTYARSHNRVLMRYYNIKANIIERLINYRYGRKMFRNPIFKLGIQIADIIYNKKTNEELICSMQDVAISKSITDYYTVYNSFYGFAKETYPASYFQKKKYIPFEDMKVPIPVGYKGILTKLYGDWHKLPPKDKRYPDYLDEMIYEEIL